MKINSYPKSRWPKPVRILTTSWLWLHIAGSRQSPTVSANIMEIRIFFPMDKLGVFQLSSTNKETGESWDIFIKWKINFRLCAVGSARLWKKPLCHNHEQLLMPVFLSFHSKKIDLTFFWKYGRVHTENLHKIKVNKIKQILGSVFYGGKTIS